MDSETILRATVDEQEPGFTLNLSRAGGRPWEQVSVTYNPEAEILTVVINGEHTWEHPIKGPDRVTPQLF